MKIFQMHAPVFVDRQGGIFVSNTSNEIIEKEYTKKKNTQL